MLLIESKQVIDVHFSPMNNLLLLHEMIDYQFDVHFLSAFHLRWLMELNEYKFQQDDIDIEVDHR
jgi:hypothetical protein